jgi:hypothetical protein
MGDASFDSQSIYGEIAQWNERVVEKIGSVTGSK